MADSFWLRALSFELLRVLINLFSLQLHGRLDSDFISKGLVARNSRLEAFLPHINRKERLGLAETKERKVNNASIREITSE
jgi:hypothetical protein